MQLFLSKGRLIKIFVRMFINFKVLTSCRTSAVAFSVFPTLETPGNVAGQRVRYQNLLSTTLTNVLGLAVDSSQGLRLKTKSDPSTTALVNTR